MSSKGKKKIVLPKLDPIYLLQHYKHVKVWKEISYLTYQRTKPF